MKEIKLDQNVVLQNVGDWDNCEGFLVYDSKAKGPYLRATFAENGEKEKGYFIHLQMYDELIKLKAPDRQRIRITTWKWLQENVLPRWTEKIKSL